MTPTEMLLGAGCVFSIGAITWLYIRNVRVSRGDWADLIARLKPANMPGVTLIALECINPHHTGLITGPEERLGIVGGIRGAGDLRRNADLLLVLASHAERWDLAESRRVAGLMRIEGLALRRAAKMLIASTILRASAQTKSRYAQAVALCYYRMTQDLQELYNQLQSSHAKDLDSVIWRSPHL